MDNNICKFVPTRGSADQINTVNFVYETVIPQRNQFITKSTYMMYLVTEGRGRLCHTQKSSDIAKGDLFFTFPSTPFAIEVSDSNLNYLYISFLGIRGGPDSGGAENPARELRVSRLRCVGGFLDGCPRSDDSV